MENNENTIVAKPTCNKILFAISVVTCFAGIISFWIGFEINSIPASIVYFGAILYSVGMLGLIATFHLLKTHYFIGFLNVWFAGAFFWIVATFGVYFLVLPFTAAIMLTMCFLLGLMMSRYFILHPRDGVLVLFFLPLSIYVPFVSFILTNKQPKLETVIQELGNSFSFEFFYCLLTVTDKCQDIVY